LACLVLVAGPADAASGQLSIPEDSQDVIQGDSVLINVTFGANDPEEDVSVHCNVGCPVWERTVVFDEEKANCEITDAYVEGSDAQESRRVCQISFPEGFHNTDGGPPAADAGEPSRAATYDVRLADDEDEAYASFDAHLSTASTCRPLSDTQTRTGAAQRTDVVKLSSSGHADGERVTLQVRDGQQIFFERTFTSEGPSIAYHFRWSVPRDLPIEGNQRGAQIVVDSGSSSDREEIAIRPGVAQPLVVRQPGLFNDPTEFNRTEEVKVWTGYRFLAAPPDCTDVPPDRSIQPVTSEQVDGSPPSVQIRRISEGPGPRTVETVDTQRTVFAPQNNLFLVNYTIPKDERATDEDNQDPVYDVRFERTQLADGNYIAAYNSRNYEVYPYTIQPEFTVLQDEVERLETAQLVMNLTYADGSPFTPNDTSEQLEVSFGQEGEGPEYTFEANHRRKGLWNVSKDLGFQYEPLGAYTWRVHEVTDAHGPPGEENRVGATVTDVVDVLSARPRLDVTTIVNDESVDGAERTQRVHVRVDARYQNGEPLTEDNVDPSMGGIGLNVDKRNEFGRIVDQERYVMTHAGDPGTWIESFRIGRTPSAAPAGSWDLEFEARDDQAPPNENITSTPASLPVRQTRRPAVWPPRGCCASSPAVGRRWCSRTRAPGRRPRPARPRCPRPPRAPVRRRWCRSRRRCRGRPRIRRPSSRGSPPR
jgi:hypothetical protein